MIKKVAILANGGDVSGFNAVIRAIVKTAENNGIECYGFIDGYNGLLKNNYIKLSTANEWICECGTKNTGKFCSNCGKKHETNKVCPKCGNINEPTSNFCNECGERL